MRIVLAVLITLFAAGAAAYVAMPQSDGSALLLLSPERVQECMTQGGCRIVTRQELDEFVRNIKPQLCSDKET